MRDSPKIYNYFLGRWRSGYGYISDAPNSVNLIIEAFLEELRSSSLDSEPSFASSYSSGTLMIAISYSARVESSDRVLTFSHVVAAEGAQNNAANMRLVERALLEVYGSSPAPFLSNLIAKICLVDKEQGRSLLSKFRVDVTQIEKGGERIVVLPARPPAVSELSEEESRATPAIRLQKFSSISEESARGISSWWLLLTAVLLAFAAGFLTHYLVNAGNKKAPQDAPQDGLTKSDLEKILQSERELKDGERELKDIGIEIRNKVAATKAADSLSSSGDRPLNTTIDDALKHGREYIAGNGYDAGRHDLVLKELLSAFAIKNLPGKVNASLKVMIGKVNDIGIAHAISDPRDSSRQLRAFLKDANSLKLTPEQKGKITNILKSDPAGQ